MVSLKALLAVAASVLAAAFPAMNLATHLESISFAKFIGILSFWKEDETAENIFRNPFFQVGLEMVAPRGEPLV